MASEKSKLNWLRAAVLGANDGIVSVAALIVGVASADTNLTTITTAGVAGLAAGALSMAAGEYISVSTQRDAEKAYIAKEKRELKEDPDREEQELVEYYIAKGLKPETARKVARELTEHDVLAAHLEAEFGLIEEDLTNPWHAAVASAVSFVVGGLIPLLSVLVASESVRIPTTFIAVLFALAITGYVSAIVSNADRQRAVVRVLIGGALAMIVTSVVGNLFGAAV